MDLRIAEQAPRGVGKRGAREKILVSNVSCFTQDLLQLGEIN